MARPRERIPLEDGVKPDLNKIRVQAISQGETTQQVICGYPRYSGDARKSAFSSGVFLAPFAARCDCFLVVGSVDRLGRLAAPFRRRSVVFSSAR